MRRARDKARPRVEPDDEAVDKRHAYEVAQNACWRLVRSKDPWLEQWGSEEGRQAWLAQDQLYGHRSRKASQAAYRRMKLKAERDQLFFGFKCLLGHGCTPVRDVYESGPQQVVTTAYCDQQDGCPDYISRDDALLELAKKPKGNA